MAEIDLSKPEKLRFYIESYEKVEQLRMRWNHKYGSMIEKLATFQGEEKGHTEDTIRKYVFDVGMQALTRDAITGARHRYVKQPTDPIPRPLAADVGKEHPLHKIGLVDPGKDPRFGRPMEDPVPDPMMRPVPREQEKVIYDGAGFGLGRKEYFKLRYTQDPETKYYIPECSSWEYGWRLKDSFFGSQCPAHGKIPLLTKGIRCRTGPAPDPKHYRSVQYVGKKICNM